MKRRVAALVAVLLAGPAVARGEVGDVGYFNGNVLYDWCVQTDRVCIGYLAGISDAQTDRMPFGTAAYCVPPGVTLEQLREVVSDYLRANAAYRQLSGSVLATIALHAAYPCVTNGKAAGKP